MRDYTPLIVMAAIVVLLGWELWTLVDHVPNNTISETVWKVITGRPFIPFLSGFLCGHFFWQQYVK